MITKTFLLKFSRHYYYMDVFILAHFFVFLLASVGLTLVPKESEYLRVASDYIFMQEYLLTFHLHIKNLVAQIACNRLVVTGRL